MVMTQQYELIAGVNIPGTMWRGNLQGALGPGYMLYECSACAAIVRDQARHDTWHEGRGS
jgi:hypothetical protein